MTNSDDQISAIAPAARGPHLPDAITRFGMYVWVFVALAVARLIWFIRQSPPVDLAPGTLITYVASVSPSIVIVLLPAALLLRHPDAAVRARTLLFGTVLFVVVEGMRLANVPLQPIFEQITPGSAETPYLVPLGLVYNAAIGILGAFALANIGLGLAKARRFEDAAGGQLIRAAMIVAVSLVLVGAVFSVSQLPLDEVSMTATVILYLASVVLVSVLFAGAWAYVALVTIRGARAREDPETAWNIAGFGAGLVIVAYVIRSLLLTVTPGPDTQAIFTFIGHALSIAVALGYLALLVALLLGLPSLDDVDTEDEVSDQGLDGIDDVNDVDDLPASDRREPGAEPV